MVMRRLRSGLYKGRSFYSDRGHLTSHRHGPNDKNIVTTSTDVKHKILSDLDLQRRLSLNTVSCHLADVMI